MIDGWAGGRVVVVVVVVVDVVGGSVVVDVVVDVVGGVVGVTVVVELVVDVEVVLAGGSGGIDVVVLLVELELDVLAIVDEMVDGTDVAAIDAVGAVAVVGPATAGRERAMVDVVYPRGQVLVDRQRTFRVDGYAHTANVLADVLTVADTVRVGHVATREYRSVLSRATQMTLGAATEIASLVSFDPHDLDLVRAIMTPDFETQKRETGAASAGTRPNPASAMAKMTRARPHVVPVRRQCRTASVPIVRPSA